FLRSLGRAPADHGGGDDPDRDRPDLRVLPPGLDDEDPDRERPQQRPGHRPARDEPARQRADVRDRGDGERRCPDREPPADLPATHVPAGAAGAGARSRSMTKKVHIPKAATYSEAITERTAR